MRIRQGIEIKRVILLLAVYGLVTSAARARAANQPIYDEQADARRDIAAAISQASKTGRNIVLIFGANW
jgi:thioredoxin 1